MFQLNNLETHNLRSQIVTSSLISQPVISKRGGSRHNPYVFTEEENKKMGKLFLTPLTIVRAPASVFGFLDGGAAFFTG